MSFSICHMIYHVKYQKHCVPQILTQIHLWNEEAPNRGRLPPIKYFKKASTLWVHFSTNITLSIRFFIVLTRLWFIRMVFTTCILNILAKKPIRHLWKTINFGLLKRKWLFISQNSWPNIHKGSILKSTFFFSFHSRRSISCRVYT